MSFAQWFDVFRRRFARSIVKALLFPRETDWYRLAPITDEMGVEHDLSVRSLGEGDYELVETIPGREPIRTELEDEAFAQRLFDVIGPDLRLDDGVLNMLLDAGDIRLLWRIFAYPNEWGDEWELTDAGLAFFGLHGVPWCRSFMAKALERRGQTMPRTTVAEVEREVEALRRRLHV